MSPILLKVLMSTLQSMPQLAQEIDKVINEAESGDDASDKAKAIISDTIKLLETLAGII